jgi:hypothetical protein
LQNISDQPQKVKIASKQVFGVVAGRVMDLITEQDVADVLNDTLALQPYQTLWLRIKS